MKIGIAGYGFVGQAHELMLKANHEILISDPDKEHNASLKEADAIIICVSTPAGSNGNCKMDNVYSVIETAPDVPILIKSTISVEGWKMLMHVFPDRDIAFSPEFLRAKHWREDALNIKELYIGGTNTTFWEQNVFVNYIISNVPPEELVVAKSVRNNFLALKVSFFNQIFDYCQTHNLDYNTVAQVVGNDNRIGHSHTEITSERGFGGHCFPKDVKALITSAKAYGCSLSLLEEASNYNNKVRKDNV